MWANFENKCQRCYSFVKNRRDSSTHKNRMRASIHGISRIQNILEASSFYCLICGFPSNVYKLSLYELHWFQQPFVNSEYPLKHTYFNKLPLNLLYAKIQNRSPFTDHVTCINEWTKKNRQFKTSVGGKTLQVEEGHSYKDLHVAINAQGGCRACGRGVAGSVSMAVERSEATWAGLERLARARVRGFTTWAGQKDKGEGSL